MTVTDYPDFATPQAHATAISTTGVPLLRGANLVTSSALQTLAGGAAVQILAMQPLIQIAWEAELLARLPSAAGTLPFCSLTFEWFDATGSFITAFRTYYFASGNGVPSPAQYQGSGPCRGELLTVTLQNLDPAQTLTYSFDCSQTSHPFVIDKWQQQQYEPTAPNGFTNPTGEPQSNVVATANPIIAIGTPAVRLLAVVTGKWRITLDNVSGANACQVALSDPTNTGIPNGQLWRKVIVAAGGVLSEDFWSPYRPVLLTLTNNGSSGSISPTFAAIAADY